MFNVMRYALGVKRYALSLKAGVAKLADVSDLGSDAARHVGSSPSTRTNPLYEKMQGVLYSRQTKHQRDRPDSYAGSTKKL
jgi:hypothetical protein